MIYSSEATPTRAATLQTLQAEEHTLFGIEAMMQTNQDD